MEPTGFRGSGRAKEALNDALRLGMIMGSSSVSELSSSESGDPRPRPSLADWLRESPGPRESVIIVDSALALPRESIVNLTCALCLAWLGDDSGIEASADNRFWCLKGETRPDCLGAPARFCSDREVVRLVRDPRPIAFFPLFSLKLLLRPGRNDGLMGELAIAR